MALIENNRLIEDIKNDIKTRPISEVLQHYIDLKKRGSEYVALSPFNEEKTPSFKVNDSKQLWKCFSSDKGGDAIQFVMEKERISFNEAVFDICQRLGIEMPVNGNHVKFPDHNKLLTFALDYFISNPVPSPFLKSRSLGKEILLKFNIGFGGSSWTGFVDRALSEGFTKDELLNAGLAHEKKDKSGLIDAYKNRVIFPIYDQRSKIIAFAGRSIDTTNPKYKNSPDSIWQKGKNLYGINLIKSQVEKLYLVEGYTDVIRMHQYNLPAVASCGTALTDDQIKLIKRFTDTVVIVPDNDLEKPENPGLKAMHKSANLLIQNGVHVCVLIPGTAKDKKNHDPDTFLKKLGTKHEVDNWLINQEDYLQEYLLRECMVRSEAGPKYASDEIQRMADIIKAIPNETLQTTYYDAIANDWPAFKKGFKLKIDKSNATPESIQKLNKDSRSDYFDFGFWEKEGAYYTHQNKSEFQICNFTIEILYFVINHNEPKYVCVFTNMFGTKRYKAITTDDFSSVSSFKKSVGRLGNFIFYGREDHLNKLKNKLFQGVKHADEPIYMGYNAVGDFYTWANGIFYNSKFYKADKFGIVALENPVRSMEEFKTLKPESQIKIDNDIFFIPTIDDFFNKQNEDIVNQHIINGNCKQLQYYYLPFANTLKLDSNEDDTYEFERRFKHFEINLKSNKESYSFEKWSNLFYRSYGTNGMIGIAFYTMALFRDIVFKENNNYIPILGLFGARQTGKSTMARSLNRMFGEGLEDGIDLESGSTATAARRYLASCSNAIVWLNEYKNSLPDSTLGMIKGIADGSGKLTGRQTAGNEIKVYKPRSAAILSGQDLPTKDPAIFSRVINCEFDGKHRQYTDHQELLEIENKGYTTAVTCDLLRYRDLIKANYARCGTVKKLREAYNKDNIKIDDRLLVNMASVLTPVSILMDAGVNFPFSFEELNEVLYSSIERQMQIQATADDVEKYFNVVAALIDQHKIAHDTHYKIVKEVDCTKLYLRIKAIHPHYLMMVNSMKEATMTEGSMRSYLEKHESFIEYRDKNVVFEFEGKKSRTSAHIFNYDMLLDKGIEFSLKHSVVSDELNI